MVSPRLIIEKMSEEIEDSQNEQEAGAGPRLTKREKDKRKANDRTANKRSKKKP